jgi:hypothetical protein
MHLENTARVGDGEAAAKFIIWYASAIAPVRSVYQPLLSKPYQSPIKALYKPTGESASLAQVFPLAGSLVAGLINRFVTGFGSRLFIFFTKAK